MVPVIGIVVVLGCIAGGYLMEKGNLLVLMQPAELLIIAGAAIGTVLIGNPIYVLKAIVGGRSSGIQRKPLHRRHLSGYIEVPE